MMGSHQATVVKHTPRFMPFSDFSESAQCPTSNRQEDIAKPKRDNRIKISCCGVTICGQRTAAAAISQTDSEG